LTPLTTVAIFVNSLTAASKLAFTAGSTPFVAAFNDAYLPFLAFTGPAKFFPRCGIVSGIATGNRG
jgi:hypothetical protein